jgi:hypothetical protein
MSDGDHEKPGDPPTDESIPEPPPYDPDLSLIGDMQRSEGQRDERSFLARITHWRRAS